MKIRCVIVLFLSLVLFSCGEEDNDSNAVQKRLIESVRVVGTKAISVTFNNELREIHIVFKKGTNLKEVELNLVLAQGVKMVSPESENYIYDLTVPTTIVLSYGEQEYAYQVLTGFSEDVAGEGLLNDIVLLYYGGKWRTIGWNKEQLKANVLYKDQMGKSHWFFDTFLFIEFKDGANGRYFEPAYDKTGDPDKIGARKVEWKTLVDTTLNANRPAHRLDEVIGDGVRSIGAPVYRRQIILTLPVPTPKQTNWGVANGRVMNFNNDEDRVTACKWYIDYAIERFNAQGFENIDLAGFYWIAEAYTTGQTILPQLTNYIRSKGLKSFWIPFNGAAGASEWKSMGFDNAYFQPNYAFPANPNISTLTSACDFAIRNNMYMEMEFDHKALKKWYSGNDYWGGRLYDYMRVFREKGILTKPVAYYQGACTIYEWTTSTAQEDIDLYHAFSSMVVDRQRALEKQK